MFKLVVFNQILKKFQKESNNKVFFPPQIYIPVVKIISQNFPRLTEKRSPLQDKINMFFLNFFI